MQSDSAVLNSIAVTGAVTTPWPELLLIILAKFEANIAVFSDCPNSSLLIDGIKETLTTEFQSAAPFTIQRLAELLQDPTQHYNDLGKYLHAIERVVTTTTLDYPLPLLAAEANMEDAELDSLGGARLVPIPFASHNGNGLHSQEKTDYEGINGIGPSDTQEEKEVPEVNPQSSMDIQSSNSPKEEGKAPMDFAN